MVPSNYKMIIGIDPGTRTGFAVWDRESKQLVEIATLSIHRAMERVLLYKSDHPDKLFVRFEDARLRKYLKSKTDAELQGAGSIKRDCTIWDHFLEDHKIPYASMAPKLGMTKMDPDKFKLWTKWQAVTSNHGRDAALLVIGY